MEEEIVEQGLRVRCGPISRQKAGVAGKLHHPLALLPAESLSPNQVHG